MALVAALVVPQGCGSVFDDLSPCPEGVRLRFVYDYHTEQGNAFPAQVDCLTVHIYDSEMRHVKTVTESTTVLADENWRMALDLPAGDYTAVAYGGVECGKASFAHASVPGDGSRIPDLAMTIKDEHVGTRLHDLFFGRLSFNVPANSTAYAEETVKMLKATNHYRILLQKTDGTATDGNDFDFTITDTNTVLDENCRPSSARPVTYTPWVKGSMPLKDIGDGSKVAMAESGDETTTAAYAELSTSRLWRGGNPVLTIRSKATGNNVLRVPLDNLLLLGQSDASPWGSQEYLDRNSSWVIQLFLNSNDTWLNTVVVINGWVVRIKDDITVG